MATPSEPGWYPDPDDPTSDRYFNGDEWTDTVDEAPEAQSVNTTQEVSELVSRRSVGAGVVVAIAAAAFASGFLLRMVTGPDHVSVAADQFCALGEGEGASLLDTAGWLKGAERTVDDFEDVIDAIDQRCPAWRRQVITRADEVGN